MSMTSRLNGLITGVGNKVKTTVERVKKNVKEDQEAFKSGKIKYQATNPFRK